MIIPIVNEQDEIIGHKERDEISAGDIIRITAIWVTDGEGNILLAQRSFTKKKSPGKWGPGAAGTVEEGETYESNAYKELEEELGLTGVTLNFIEKRLYTSTTGTKFSQLYSLVVPKDTRFHIPKDEVEQVRWFSKEEFTKALEERSEDFVYALTLLKEVFENL